MSLSYESIDVFAKHFDIGSYVLTDKKYLVYASLCVLK